MTSLIPTVKTAFANWKSTVSGFLTVTLVTSVALGSQPWITNHPKLAAALGTAQILAKAYISLITKDEK